MRDTARDGAPPVGLLGSIARVGASPPAPRSVARPEGGATGGPSASPAVGTDCAGAVGGSPADPLHAAGPPGVYGAPLAGHGVPPPRRGGVHTNLVRPRQGACHTAEGPPGPGQHDGVGVAGAAPAPASRKGRGAAGAPGISAVARGELTRSPRLPLPLPRPTHLRTARTQHTQPSPFTFTRG